MTRPVCKGDPTSHGGFVKTASSTWELKEGSCIALLHDIVTCPEHGDNPIIQSGEGYEEHGRPWVVDGCKTQCGSIVRATIDGFDIA